MTTRSILNALTEKGIISVQQADAVASFENSKAFSIHLELRTILYLGILMFSSGIGILIYEHIDTIGHQVIIASIALLTGFCFWYAIKNSPTFSRYEVIKVNKFAPYSLLLGCATFLALEGYLQFQYSLFGTKYGLAVLIPTILFFFNAYRFDHTGVLSMAITGLASWLGLTIAPLSVLSENDFTDPKLVWSAAVLGTVLVAFAWISSIKEFKKHFTNTYFLLGGNLAFIAILVGVFTLQPFAIFSVLGLALSAFFILTARRSQSLLFLLMGVVYAYIHITYLLTKLIGEAMMLALASFYFMISSVGVILFLLNYKKFLGIKK
jgi:hypothetical protein